MKKKYFLIPILLSFYLIFLSVLTIVSVQGKTLKLKPDQLLSLDKVYINYVYDGDTVRTAGGKDIRLIGVDTPEMNWEKGQPEYFARKAFEYTKEKLWEKSVYLEYDQEHRDKYGRTLAYLFMKDGSFFNQKLLTNGYAGLLLIPPNLKYSQILKMSAAKARKNSRGIWSEWNIFLKKLPIISWKQASDYLNKNVIVRGKVRRVHKTERVVFVDFTERENDALYLVIFKDSLNRFDYDPEFLLGKKIKVEGKIEEYKGSPEIIVESPVQIVF